MVLLLLQALCRLGGTVLGVDACEESVCAAKAHAGRSPSLQSRLEYHCGTVEELAGQQGSWATDTYAVSPR